MFIIDFDDTLFDTQSGFSGARVSALKPFGISEQLYKETYLKARNNPNGEVIYNNRRHAQVLRQYGFSEDDVFETLEASCKPARLKFFLFPDAIDFLKKLKSLGEPMVLLSLGEKEFQYQKIKALQMEKYFDRIFMTNTEKDKTMKEILEYVSDKVIWFINDKINETKAMHSLFPILRPLLKQSLVESPEAYRASGWPHYKTLTEIYEHIVTHR